MHQYKIFTLNVSSDIAFDFEETPFDDEEVRFELKPCIYKNLVEDPKLSVKGIEGMKLKVDTENVAVFILDQEDKVEIYPYEEKIHLNEIALHLLGNIFALIMLRRGFFIIHGSCVNIDGKGVIITGDGGAGKSTLARGFMLKGHEIVTDDLSFINDKDEVLPSYPSQKLWKDSMDNYGLCDYSQPIYSRQDKFNVSNREQFYNKPIELSAIVWLNVDDVNGVNVEELTKYDRLNALLANTYREEFLMFYDLHQSHFSSMVKLAGKIKAIKLTRPVNEFTIENQIQIIMNNL